MKIKLQFVPILYRDWSVVFCEICRMMMTDEFYKYWHWKFTDICYVWDGKKVAIYRDKEEQAKGMARNIILRIDRDKNFIINLAEKSLDEVQQIESFFKVLLKKEFNKIPAEELSTLFQTHINKSAEIGPKILITQYLPVYIEEKNLLEKYKKEMAVCLKARIQWEKIVGPLSDLICIKFAEEALREVDLDKNHARFISINEIKSIFLKEFSQKKIKKLETQLKRRTNSFLLAGGKFQNCLLKNYLEKNGWKLAEERITKNIKEFRGESAFEGIVRGIVKVVNNKKESSRIKRECIIVSPAIIPEFISILKMAKAIITDEGGVTSHSAIISRELKIPCVVGTKFATKVLRDGDLVEVDANKGIVKILRKK